MEAGRATVPKALSQFEFRAHHELLPPYMSKSFTATCETQHARRSDGAAGCKSITWTGLGEFSHASQNGKRCAQTERPLDDCQV